MIIFTFISISCYEITTSFVWRIIIYIAFCFLVMIRCFYVKNLKAHVFLFENENNLCPFQEISFYRIRCSFDGISDTKGRSNKKTTIHRKTSVTQSKQCTISKGRNRGLKCRFCEKTQNTWDTKIQKMPHHEIQTSGLKIVFGNFKNRT